MAEPTNPPLVTPDVAEEIRKKNVTPDVAEEIRKKIDTPTVRSGVPFYGKAFARQVPPRVDVYSERGGVRAAPPSLPEYDVITEHGGVRKARGPLAYADYMANCDTRFKKGAAKRAARVAEEGPRREKISHKTAVDFLLRLNEHLPEGQRFTADDFAGKGLSRRAHDALATHGYELRKLAHKKKAKKAAHHAAAAAPKRSAKKRAKKKTAKRAKKRAKKAAHHAAATPKRSAKKTGKRAKKAAKKTAHRKTVSASEARRLLKLPAGHKLTAEDKDALACEGVHVKVKRRAKKAKKRS